MDRNFEVGTKRIFFTDGQFLTISREIIYARFAKAEIERGRERGNYVVREKLGVFLRFFHFFSMKCLPDQNQLSTTKNSP